MGYYLDWPDGISHGKADRLIKDHQAVETSPEFLIGTGQELPVVVVDNGPFEAAAIGFSAAEVKEFTRPTDYRPKRYLLVPTSEVLKINPSVASEIAWDKL